MACGPEARADVHRADFSNRDEARWTRRHTERKHTEATLDGWEEGRKGGEGYSHRWLEKAGAALLWRKAFCCRSHSSRLTDRKASEHDAITGHDASRHSRLDSHGEASRLEKDQQKAPISARWHASLKDSDAMRAHTHGKKSSFIPFYYPALARIEIDLVPVSIDFFFSTQST